MDSVSKCIFYICAVLVLQYVIVPTSALPSTKFMILIDKLCQESHNKTFCTQTLSAYPPAARATALFPLAEAAINLALSHAHKCENISIALANKIPRLKPQFTGCGKAFADVALELKAATFELKDEPEDANYSVMICNDSMRNVVDLIGVNKDKASKILMGMTSKMYQLLDVAVAATVVVGG